MRAIGLRPAVLYSPDRVRTIRTALYAAAMSGPAAPLRLTARHFRRPCVTVDAETVRVQTVFGHWLHLDARDISLRPDLVLRGYWEPGVTRALMRLARPGQRVVEVGANVGWHTLLLALAVGASGTVTAFEANPRMVALLERTLALNDAANVQVVPLAVTDRIGRVTLHRLGRQQGSSSIYPFGPADLAVWDDAASPLAVDAISLDAFFGPNAPGPDLVKIDAEGAEPAIVAGMHGLLARTPHVQIVLEYLPSGLRRGGHDPRAFLTSLTQLGFRLHTISRRGRFRPATIDQLLASEDAEELYLRR